MDESPTAASLHEYVDFEITLAEPVTPAQEKALRDYLTDHDGVQTVNIMREKVSVNYEPVSVSARDLLAAVERAGVQVTESEAGPSSPMTDAFEKNLQSPGQTPERSA